MSQQNGCKAISRHSASHKIFCLLVITTWALFQYKDNLSTGMGIPMLKVRQSGDHLIFNMGTPILVRRHIYIETAPTMRTKDRQYDNFVATGGIVSCHYDNLLCHQAWQICQTDDLLFSMQCLALNHWTCLQVLYTLNKAFVIEALVCIYTKHCRINLALIFVISWW